ncbi:MAG: 3,4-dihydroxy-2-butanone-4-phosphate synthase, partial [Pseudomonadota bacterium]
LSPSAVICEIMNDDGTMARLPDLQEFARQHQIRIGTIADLITHRSRNETLIERLGHETLTTPWGAFDSRLYRDRTGQVHLALAVGAWAPEDEVLVRVHEPLSVMDLLDVGRARHSWALPRALATLQEAGRGVAVLLNIAQDAQALLGVAMPPQGEPPRPTMDLRTYGVGAQILRDLGVRRMKLLSNRRRMPSMVGYGLEVTGFMPVDPA